MGESGDPFGIEINKSFTGWALLRNTLTGVVDVSDSGIFNALVLNNPVIGNTPDSRIMRVHEAHFWGEEGGEINAAMAQVVPFTSTSGSPVAFRAQVYDRGTATSLPHVHLKFPPVDEETWVVASGILPRLRFQVGGSGICTIYVRVTVRPSGFAFAGGPTSLAVITKGDKAIKEQQEIELREQAVKIAVKRKREMTFPSE